MLKTCAYKIGNRLILKLSIFSKKRHYKEERIFPQGKKRRISKQSEAKLANPPPTGNCDCASLEGGIIGIAYSVENAIVFFLKKGTVGGIRLCAASLHCPSAFLYSFRLIRETGNPSYRGS